MRRETRWPDAETALLRSLWPDHSASIIVQRLRLEHGFEVSREAVIGKAYRLKLVKGRANVEFLPSWHRVRTPEQSSAQLLGALALEKRFT